MPPIKPLPTLVALLSLGLLAAIGLVCCTRSADSQVEVRLVLPPKSATRGVTSDNLDCFLLNVTGPGLVSTAPAAVSACYNGSLGELSPVVARPVSTDPQIVTLRMRIPAGEARTVQVLGVATGQGPSACTTSLGDFFAPGRAPVQLYEYGKNPQPMGLFHDTALSVYNSFQPIDLFQSCASAFHPTPPNSFALTLTHAYQGYGKSAGGNPDFSEPINFQIPPLSSDGPPPQPLLPTELAALNSQGGFTTAIQPIASDFARLDLVFSTQTQTVSNYSGLQVNFYQIAAGLTPTSPASGSCLLTPFSAAFQTPEFELRLAKDIGGGIAAWSSVGFTPGGTGATDYTFTIPGPLASYALLEADTIDQNNDVFFHLSLRNTQLNVIGSQCAAFTLKGVQIVLVP